MSLVAYRDADGGTHVLSDTCIHRSGSLSKGKVAGNNIHCPCVQHFYEAPLSPPRTRISFVNARNNNMDPENDDWINKTFLKITDEDIAILENLWPKRTPDTLTKELVTPGDAAVVRYREYLKDWGKRCWRIDLRTLQQHDDDIAWAIPCPARRESGNWVLDPIPMVNS